jgi:hypothetical protein
MEVEGDDVALHLFFLISIFEPIPRRIALLLLPLTDCARVPARLGRGILFAV